MRIIAYGNLREYAHLHPETQPYFRRWSAIVRAGRWRNTQEVLAEFRTAKALGAGRVRFQIHGGSYRLIVAFVFEKQIAYIKFIGTHAEYDKVDAITVSQF